MGLDYGGNMTVNFTLFQNEKGTWCVLFPGTLVDMPGNNRLQALLHIRNMLFETETVLQTMIDKERQPDALETPT